MSLLFPPAKWAPLSAFASWLNQIPPYPAPLNPAYDGVFLKIWTDGFDRY
jgi:hypothetical protein